MPSNQYFIGSIYLAVTGLLFVLVTSFVPILGLFTSYPIPDLFLLSASALIVGFLPRKFRWRFLIFICLWTLLSVIRDLHNLPALILGKPISTSAQVQIVQPLTAEANRSISIQGHANPIVVSRGYAGEFKLSIHSAFMIEGVENRSNASAYLDFTNELWKRGYKPEIGTDIYPKVNIKLVPRLVDMDLSILVFDAPNHVVAKYRSRLELPPRYQLGKSNASSNWIGYTFSANFWRYALGLYKEVDPYEEILKFLDKTLGTVNVQPKQFLKLYVKNDNIIQQTGDMPAYTYLHNISSTLKKNEPRKGDVGPYTEKGLVPTYWDVCNVSPRLISYGNNGAQSPVWVIPSTSPTRFNILQGGWHDFGLLTFYCNSEEKKILSFSSLDIKPKNIKISKYAITGELEQVLYFELPPDIPKPRLLLPGSLLVSGNGVVSFTSLYEVRTKQSQNETADADKYRSIEFTSKN